MGSHEKHKERIDNWLAQFSTNNITVSMIVEIMNGKKDTENFKRPEVTENFKLNFLIVMSNILIETPTNSYFEKQLLRFDDDLDNCCYYNWAEYLINRLVAGTESWNRTSSTFFTGSLIFLTVSHFFLSYILSTIFLP